MDLDGVPCTEMIIHIDRRRICAYSLLTTGSDDNEKIKCDVDASFVKKTLLDDKSN